MLFVFLPCIGGGLIQTTTGFGCGIFIMMFFPLFLPLIQSSALSGVASLCLIATLAWKYRKNIAWKALIAPTVFYLAASYTAISLSTHVPVAGLKAYFGLFLLIIAVYFMFFDKRIHIPANLLTAGVCGTLSGTASGFFGIGGPPMVLYFLAGSGDDKMRYLGTIQMFFFITGAFNATFRAINGIFTADIMILVIPGVLGLLVGKWIGIKIIEKINIDQLKKIIYAFLGLSGILTFVTNI